MAANVIVSRSANRGRTIELSIGSLHQAAARTSAVSAACSDTKTIERRQGALSGDFEDCAVALGPALGSSAIEVTVGCLYQPSDRGFTVGTVRLAAKAIKRRQGALSGDFEDCAVALGPALGSCAIEVSVGCLNQSYRGVFTVSTVRLAAKAVKRR